MSRRNVEIIPAKPKFIQQGLTEQPKLKVAAYCRVSTSEDEQLSSFEAQREHYFSNISNNPAWEYAGIYADEGISGTSTKKREQFNSMIEDCLSGKIDMILTKSVSRFARNTLDCLQYIRLLKENNIAVYFEKENINTLDAKGEIILVIISSLAQEESFALSHNTRWGIVHRFQNGKVVVNAKRFLGYDKDESGELIIVPEQAEIIKRIYREFLEGKSTRQIAKGLTRDGLKNGAGNTKWYESNIITILKNEKYMGDARLQKTYTVDFLTKKRVKNNGIVQAIMLPIAMNLLFQVKILQQYKLSLRDVLQFAVTQRLEKTSMAVSIPFRGCFFVIIVEQSYSVHAGDRVKIKATFGNVLIRP